MLGIIDYGMGNLRSVQKGFESQGVEALVTSDHRQLENSAGLVLPGVGAFRDAMAEIKKQELDLLVKDQVKKGKPLLGICLGLQLLFEYSEEKGHTPGLGLFEGKVELLGTRYKIPHMGWNELEFQKSPSLVAGIPEGTFTYFVHSYHVLPRSRDIVVATCDYGQEIVAVAGSEHVYGIQFHPEKSSSMGLAILKNFARMVKKS